MLTCLGVRRFVPQAVGEWYGPVEVARVLQELVAAPAAGLGSRLRVWRSMDLQVGVLS